MISEAKITILAPRAAWGGQGGLETLSRGVSGVSGHFPIFFDRKFQVFHGVFAPLRIFPLISLLVVPLRSIVWAVAEKHENPEIRGLFFLIYATSDRPRDFSSRIWALPGVFGDPAYQIFDFPSRS